MGTAQGLALGAKNEALKLLSVSTRTMIFATNVLAVMLIARLFGIEKLKLSKILAGILLATGGLIQGGATFQQLRHGTAGEDKPMGYLLAVVALLLDAMRWVLLQAVLTQDASPVADTLPGHPSDASQRCTALGDRTAPGKSELSDMSNMRMVSWVMWMTTPVCLALSLIFEPTGLAEAWRKPIVLVLVGLLTLGVTGINLAEFGVVEQTSAVTFNVLSQLHSIPMVLSGVICFGETVDRTQSFGFGLCLIGALLYSVAKAAEKRSMMMRLPENEHPGHTERNLEIVAAKGTASVPDDSTAAATHPHHVRRVNSNSGGGGLVEEVEEEVIDEDCLGPRPDGQRRQGFASDDLLPRP